MALKQELLFYTTILITKLLDLLTLVVQKIFDFIYLPKSLNTNECVVYSVYKNWKTFDLASNRIECFLLKYNRAEPVEYCQSADISLYSVQKDYFFFAKTTPGANLCNVEKFPFHYAAQHDHAVELIKVRHDVVREYLKSVRGAHDGSNIVILYSTGRCGSTLSAAMLYNTHQVVVMSEPSPLLSLVLYHKDYNIPFTSSETHDIVADTLRLIAPDSNKTYLLKTDSAVIQILPLVHAALPGIKEVFMCRNVKQTALSFKKIYFKFKDNISFPTLDMFAKIYMPDYYRKLFSQHQDHGFDFDQMLVFYILAKIHMWVTEAKTRSNEMLLFLYEDLMSNPVESMTKLFVVCKIDLCHMAAALAALDEDSQKNSALSIKEFPQNCATIKETAVEVGIRIAEELGLVMDNTGKIHF